MNNSLFQEIKTNLELLKLINKMIYQIKTKVIDKEEYIFDYTRNKYLKNNAEEWVRQNFIIYLNKKKKATQ